MRSTKPFKHSRSSGSLARRIQYNPGKRDYSKRHRLHPWSLALLSRHGVKVSRYHDRPWLSLPFQKIRQTAGSPNQASAHPALHARHQRHSRAFYPDAATGWAYTYCYQSSDARTRELPFWIEHYNFYRPHSSPRINHLFYASVLE